MSAQEIEDRAARSAQQRVYALADALLSREGPREAVRCYLRLREQGERLSGLNYLMASRLRDALALSLRLQSGASTAELKRTLRMPARAAERFLADIARAEPEQLRAALAALADLELDTRGGSPLPGARSRLSGLDEDTLALRALEAIARLNAAGKRGKNSRVRYAGRGVDAERQLGGCARARARGAGLLARAGVLVHGAALDRLVDRALQQPVLLGRTLLVAVSHGSLQAAEVRLHGRGIAAVLQSLTLGAQDPLLLRVDIRHLCSAVL